MDIKFMLIIFALALPVISSVVVMVKKGFTFGGLFSVLVSSLLFVGTIFLMTDADAFSNTFPDASKIILLEQDGLVIAGFTGRLSENETPHFLDKQQVNTHQIYFREKQLANIKGPHYKALVISTQMFDHLPPGETLSIGDEVFTVAFVKELMTAKEPTKQYVEELIKRGSKDQRFGDQPVSILRKQLQSEIKEQIGGDTQLKGAFFGGLLAKGIEKEKTRFILRGIKQRKITIYKETFLFKIIKILPMKVIDLLVGGNPLAQVT